MKAIHRWDAAIASWNQQPTLTAEVARGTTVPLTWPGVETSPLGFVRREIAAMLAADHGDVFELSQTLTFTEQFVRQDPLVRTGIVASVTRSLAASGALQGWRSENVHVARTYGAAPYFDIERASSRVLGLVAYAAHLNGFSRQNECDALWIATRSTRKTVDPGKYDNMVGGRIGAGFSAIETMRKEAWEEAGVPAALSQQIRATGAVTLCYPTPDGWHREVLFVHDVQLPVEFTPQNQDGEVARFDRFDVETLIPLTTDERMTFDAAAVTVNWLIRRGHIAAEHPDYLALHTALAPLPATAQ